MSERSRYTWNHTSLIGGAWHAEAQLQRILKSPSATENAKKLANKMLNDMCTLKQELKIMVLPKIPLSSKKDS